MEPGKQQDNNRITLDDLARERLKPDVCRAFEEAERSLKKVIITIDIDTERTLVQFGFPTLPALRLFLGLIGGSSLLIAVLEQI